MSESLLIGLTGLQAQRLAMEVTSHNLANATTDGYSRQKVDLQATTPEEGFPGQIGTGVNVAAIKRIVDNLTDQRLRASTTETSRLGTLSTNLQTVEAAFNEPSDSGFSGVTNQLFNTLTDLSNNPESAALRSTAVQELQTWTGTLNDLASRLSQIAGDAENSIRDQVDEINNITAQIATLNQQIRRQTNSGNDPNDLLDTRDGLVSKLAGYLQLSVINNADGSVMVNSSGVNLVGSDSANKLRTALSPGGGVMILVPNGGVVRPSGGSLGALDELDREIVPAITASLDSIASTMAQRMNEVQATGTSQAMKATGFLAAYTVPTSGLGTDLDDPSLAQTAGSGPGIPASATPSFTDSAGNPVVRDLTINLRNTATGVATKYIVRYDPGAGSDTRSLQDLVQAINTGSGGGFTVIPANAIGIANLSARAAPVDGGYQLQLTAATGYTLDFSQALDTSPAAGQWAGPQVSVVSTLPIPPQIGTQLQFQVEPIAPGSSTLQMRILTRNASDGSASTIGIVPLSGAGTYTVPGIGGSGSLDVTLGAGNFRAGDSFVVKLNQAGNVLQNGSNSVGTFDQFTQRPLTDAGFTITGNYSGGLGLLANPSGGTPLTTWSMRVVSGGTIGAAASSNPADPVPPVVEFTYWTGNATSPVQKTVAYTLDNKLPSGAPVQIADGVYAVFKSGDLTATTPGDDTSFVVDGQPDQAGLLPALGVNSLFTGSTAAGIRVNAGLVADPTQLAVGRTRSEGDNSNLRLLIAARQEKLFANGAALDDTYNTVLSDVGSRISQGKRLSQNQDSITAALKNQRGQLSGISIDEEVGQLILQQQAYSAAAKVVTFSRENIQTLLQMVS